MRHFDDDYELDEVSASLFRTFVFGAGATVFQTRLGGELVKWNQHKSL